MSEIDPDTPQALYREQSDSDIAKKQIIPVQPIQYERSMHSTVTKSSEGYRFDFNPAHLACMNCQEMITTEVSYKCGLLTWSVSVMLCLTGCWIGCCLIPFCMRQTKDAIHRCPNCGTIIGVHRNC